MTTGNRTSNLALSGSRYAVTNGGVSITQESFGVLNTTVGKSWVGGDNPMYQSLIDQTLSATNNYTLNVSKVLFARSARSLVQPATNNGYRWTYHSTYGQGNNTVAWDVLLVSKLTNAAMTRLYGKLYELQASYGGLELLAEFRSTIHMIKHPAEALAAYTNERASKLIAAKQEHLRKKDMILRSRANKRTIIRRLNREEKAFTRMLSASWLEFRFGAKPFIDTLAAMADVSLEVFPSEGAVKLLKVTEKSVFTTVRTQVIGFGNQAYTEVFEEDWEYTVQLKARVRYAGQYDGMSQLELLKAKGGFELKQGIPLAWELAPLSVFIDYFVNVGDILQASMTETKDVKSVDRYITRKLIRRSRIDFNPVGWGPMVYPPTRQGLVVTYYKQYSREKWAMTIPSLTFTTPADSLIKSTNLLAFVNLAFR